MNKRSIVLSIICLLSAPLLKAQTCGCTDPLATNYNAAATCNDGSCVYASASISPLTSVTLPGTLVETSGLIKWNSLVWSHCDNSNLNVYGLDTITGTIQLTKALTGTSNIDWEEISQDDGYIYLGDFGNNGNGNRTNLRILRVEKSSLLADTPQIDTIAFSYSNQTSFEPTGSNNTDFDCEAFVVCSGGIYLFTKQWVSEQTSVYSLPNAPGTHIAQLESTYNVNGLITGSVYLEDKNVVALCGYSSTLQPFVYLLYDFEGHDFFGGNKRKIGVSLAFHQIEGITSSDGLRYYMSNEYLSYSIITTAQKLHTFDLSAYLSNFLVSVTVSTSASPLAGGTTSGGGSFSIGQACTVNAVANTGYTFTNWTENGSVVSTSPSYTFTVSGNTALVANFSCLLPERAGTISGKAKICKGASVETYSVPVIANAQSYAWTLPAGATGSSTTNSITVSFGENASSGNITVKGINTCGEGTASTLAITINPLPGAAGAISGAESVCPGQTAETYSVPVIANAQSYAWTLPAGATGTSTTNSITVSFGENASSGNISVKGINTCGEGTASSLPITINPLPGAAGAISGAESVCPGQSAETYSVPAIANAQSYAWTLPAGATGTSTTNSITVSFGENASSGNITVKGINTCGEGSASTLSVTINPLPGAAGVITGAESVCPGQTAETYSVTVIANAQSYAWTLPDGATGSSTTNSIAVNYSANATSGTISVKGINSCGEGEASIFTVTITPLPEAAGEITGTASVCPGQASAEFTVPVIAYAQAYSWTLPGGAVGTSTTNSINVDFGVDATSGDITVRGVNHCGEGEVSVLPVTILPLPVAAGTITGTTSICPGQTAEIYSVPVIDHAQGYIWTLPGGAVGTSTTNSINVDFGVDATSGDITVKGVNSCGEGEVSVLPITVNPTPPTPRITLNGFDLSSDAPFGNQWYDGYGRIDGATDPVYSVTRSGDYFVVVTIEGCSSYPSNSIRVIGSGKESPGNDRTLKVYPNPMGTELVIELEGNSQLRPLEILNAIGQIVWQGEIFKQLTVATRAFLPGVYWIKVATGDSVDWKRIVKE